MQLTKECQMKHKKKLNYEVPTVENQEDAKGIATDDNVKTIIETMDTQVSVIQNIKRELTRESLF